MCVCVCVCVYFGSISSLIHLSDTSSIAQHLKTFMPNNTIAENSHRQHNNIRTSK